MAKDRYISARSSVSGFSFANLGLFTGFADGIYNAVYSLVILEIFRNSAVVGIYVAIYSVFCMIVALFAKEIFRQFSKVKVFYFALLMLVVCYAMMGFSVLPRTFIVLDYTSGFAITLSAMLIPLFMSDFSGDAGMARLNSRYHLWTNVGALLAQYFRLIQEDKQIKPMSPRRTVRSLIRNALVFFRTPGMLRAYLVNFGFYSLRAMRYLYVPILVIENGFNKDTLGLVLTIGIIPYLLLSEVMGRLVRRFGKKLWLVLGFGSFAAFSLWATVATGFPLLAIFVLWQISGAFMEPVHDLLFFDNTKKSQQTRFYGVFRTSVNLPSVIAPIIGAACITLFGVTSAVWFVTAAVGVISVMILLSKK